MLEVENLRGTKICVATPCYDGRVTTQFSQSLANTMKLFSSVGIDVTFLTVANDAVISKARNTIASEFMKLDCAWLLMIDSDIGWNPEDILVLLCGQKHFSGIAYPARAHTAQFMCNILQNDPIEICDKTAFIKASHIATGFMLLSKECVSKMWQAHMKAGKWYYAQETREKVACLFEQMISEHHEFWTEDFVFCQKWLDMGGDVWLHANATLSHTGVHTWKGSLASTMDMKILSDEEAISYYQKKEQAEKIKQAHGYLEAQKTQSQAAYLTAVCEAEAA